MHLVKGLSLANGGLPDCIYPQVSKQISKRPPAACLYRGSVKVLSVFRTMALDCERVHQQLHHDSSVKPFYYRFNPTLTKKIGLDEWKKIEKMEGIAFEYLNDHTMSRRVTRCAAALS